jgi:hypothetical protein
MQYTTVHEPNEFFAGDLSSQGTDSHALIKRHRADKERSYRQLKFPPQDVIVHS